MNMRFYPFHAINEFMRPDFRLSLIRDVLSNIDSIPPTLASDLDNATNRMVKIPGFRNSAKAPFLVKVMPMAKSYENSSDIVAAILSAWAAIHSDIALQVYNLLKKRNWPSIDLEGEISFAALAADIVEQWPILPPEVNRKRAPGFNPHWPKGEDFEALYSTFLGLYPESEASIDQVSLMAVWLTLRLPYNLDEIDLTTTETATNSTY